MKIFASPLHLFVFFVSFFFTASCTFDGASETDESLAAADAGNQIVEVKKDELLDSEIPNPEQVAQDTAIQTEGGPESIDTNSSGLIQDLAVEQQASQGPQLAGDTSDGSEGKVRDAANSAQPVSDLVAQDTSDSRDNLPSLSQVVEESHGTTQKSKKSKTAKTKAQEIQKAEETSAPEVESSASLADASLSATDQDVEAQKAPKSAKKKRGKTQAVATADADASSAVAGTVYTVQPGDTLGRIARTIYGSSSRWKDLAEWNGLNAQSMIFPGDMIKFQSDASSQAFENRLAALKASEIQVDSQDTLALLAERHLGNSSYWKLIWRWNQDKLPDPNRIFRGQTLTIYTKEELMGLSESNTALEPAH